MAKPKAERKLTSPMDDYSHHLRDRMRAVTADRDLTRSARNAVLMELVDTAVQFILLFQLMSVQPDKGKPHRPATEEEIRERVASCVDGVSIERFVAEMGDRGINEEQAWDAAFYLYGSTELWGMTYAESIQAASSLGVKYNPILELNS